MHKFITFILLGFVSMIVPGVRQVVPYDIVIYGGGFSGCAAASTAASFAPNQEVLLVIPEPVHDPGGLGTVGGQNFADVRYWEGKLVTSGSFGWWYNKAGQFYNTEAMAEIIKEDLARFPNLKIIYGSDIRQVRVKNERIYSIYICPVIRDENGIVKWQAGKNLVSGKVFIDASVDGRLSRLAGVPLNVGRQDWPEQYLTAGERSAGTAYQQAATLMFKVTGIKVPDQPKYIGEWAFTQDFMGNWGLAGGKQTWANDPIVTKFNKKYSQQGFSIKPVNAAQNGAGSNEWWVNTLLVYNVDARTHMRDKGSSRYPNQTMPNHLTVDEAWAASREFLQKPEFMKALRRFKVQEDSKTYGFAEAELVLDSAGKPVVGEVLYLRESVHTRLSMKHPVSDSENSSFAVSTVEAQKAGTGYSEGMDAENYAERIGLGYYMMDINAYQPADLMRNGEYNWPVTSWLRPDWFDDGGEPGNPVYLPYRMLVTEEVENLLLPGYAAGCSSFAWAELRVLPNLAVLGDAAGVAAVRAVSFNESPNEFSSGQIGWMQDRLKEMGAVLEK